MERIVLHGSRHNIGASTAAMLLASKVEGTYISTDDQVVFGPDGGHVYDSGAVLGDIDLEPGVVVALANPIDLALVDAHRDSVVGLVVVDVRNPSDPDDPVLSPFEFMDRLDLPLVAHFPASPELAYLTRSGMIRLGMHSAAGLKVHPEEFARLAPASDRGRI